MGMATAMFPLIPSSVEQLADEERDPTVTSVLQGEGEELVLLSMGPMFTQSSFNKGMTTQ